MASDYRTELEGNSKFVANERGQAILKLDLNAHPNPKPKPRSELLERMEKAIALDCEGWREAYRA